MAKRPSRKTNRTVLIVVEGETEQAFASHIKNLYYQRGMQLSVSIRYAPGDPTDTRYYTRHFPLEVLEQARGTVPVLDALIAAVSTAGWRY